MVLTRAQRKRGLQESGNERRREWGIVRELIMLHTVLRRKFWQRFGPSTTRRRPGELSFLGDHSERRQYENALDGLQQDTEHLHFLLKGLTGEDLLQEAVNQAQLSAERAQNVFDISFTTISMSDR